MLNPQRDPRTGHRQYRAADVRDAELAHLLRRGGQSLATITIVVAELRDAGSVQALRETLTRWRSQLRSRGLAHMNAAAALSVYLTSPASSATTSGTERIAADIPSPPVAD